MEGNCSWVIPRPSLAPWSSSLSKHQNHPEGFLKQIAEPTFKVSDSEGLGWGLRICTANKFPGAAAAQGTTGRASQPGVILLPRGHLAVSEDVFDFHPRRAAAGI